MYSQNSSTIIYSSANGIEAILTNAKTKMDFKEEEEEKNSELKKNNGRIKSNTNNDFGKD